MPKSRLIQIPNATLLPVQTASLRSSPSLLAHQVELSEEVGGTLHIEPNDVAQAGEDTQVWFALVRKGGQSLPLDACDCQLSVYALPRQAGDVAIATPTLTPLSTEGYVDIPAANVVFPAVGQYELVMTGQPAGDEPFTPFELSYQVVVATGQSTTATVPAPETTSAPTSEATAETKVPNQPVASTTLPENGQQLVSSGPIIITTLGIVLGIGALYVFVRSRFVK